MLRLQASAGNVAVAGLLRARALQRDAAEKAGWGDPDPDVDPAAGFSWNAAEHLVGTVRRFPLHGLKEGLQSEEKGGASGKLKTEPAKGRAIALVPRGLLPKKP